MTRQSLKQKALFSLKIVIAGAGISGKIFGQWFGTRHMLKAPEGLAAAFALRRAGHDVVVLERNETLVKGNGSIRSQPNMTRILYHWGLEKWLQENAQISREIKTWDAVNIELLGSVLLHEELLKQMSLQNMLIIPVDDSCQGMICAVADRSTRCAFNTDRYSIGNVASNRFNIKFVVSVDEVADADSLKPIIGSRDWHVYLGDRYRIGITTTNHGRDLDVSLTYSLESHGAPPSLSDLEDNRLYPIDLFRLDMRRFHPSIQKLLAGNRLVRAFKYFGQPIIECLTSERPRIVLIGEAGHPQLPYGLYNAGFGIEDAESLAILLSKLQYREELPQLLSGFDDVRHNRCLLVQGTDRDKYKLFTLPPGPESEARNEKIKKAVVAREWENIDEAGLPSLWQGQIELFSYDVTERVEDWWMKWGWLVRRTGMDSNDSQMDEEASDKVITPNLQVSVVTA
ncbi:hypothetical protein F5887DRAFT_1072530 [Amanita rubescens]|nr:hypothetical protein F5887DRAFT_1072530 [Amanita rubescens]